MEIGNYKVQEKIGSGKFGTVYRAIYLPENNFVAIKYFHSKLVKTPGFLEQLRQIVSFAVNSRHKNIVPILDFGEEKGFWYISMPYMAGGSLQDIFDDNRNIKEESAIKIFNQIATGISHAHKNGVTHLDIKPSNILFDEYGTAKVSDVGFLNVLSDQPKPVQLSSSQFIGTPYYMAPEIWEGGAATDKSDQYSLGCILYEMLTEEKLFSGDTPSSIRAKHFQVLSLSSKLPEAFINIIVKSTEKNPADRFSTIDEMYLAVNPSLQPKESHTIAPKATLGQTNAISSTPSPQRDSHTPKVGATSFYQGNGGKIENAGDTPKKESEKSQKSKKALWYAGITALLIVIIMIILLLLRYCSRESGDGDFEGLPTNTVSVQQETPRSIESDITPSSTTVLKETSTQKPNNTATPTKTPTKTQIPTLVPTNIIFPTNTPVILSTRTFTPTQPPTYTPSPEPSHTPSRTPSYTPTYQPTSTPTHRPSNTPTNTLMPMPSNTPTRTREPYPIYP